MLKKDFEFEFDKSVLLSYAGRAVEKKLQDPRNSDVFERAKQRFNDLVRPLAVWNRFAVDKYEHEKVLLYNGTKIGNGPFVEVVAGAEELVIVVCTVGKKLEEHAKKLMKTGSALDGIILDGMASWAVDNIRCQFYDWISADLHANEGFRTSTFLSPGESVWSIYDQEVIFALLAGDIPEHAVTLTESNVMVPFKSLSMVFGIGPNEMGRDRKSVV